MVKATDIAALVELVKDTQSSVSASKTDQLKAVFTNIFESIAASTISAPAGSSLVENNIVAHSGGSQANAYILTKKLNRITTCAANFDSVKTDAAEVGEECLIYNDTAKILTVYPKVGEKINGMTNVGINIGAGESLRMICLKGTDWVICMPTKRLCKRLKFLLSQDGVAAPTVDVIENTIGDAVWTRQSASVYRATLAGAFPILKRSIKVGLAKNLDGVNGGLQESDTEYSADFIEFYAFDSNGAPADSVNRLLIEIEVEYIAP